MSQECSLVCVNGIVETLKSVAKKCHISTWATLRILVRTETAGQVHTDHMHGVFATHLELNGALLSMTIILSVLTFA